MDGRPGVRTPGLGAGIGAVVLVGLALLWTGTAPTRSAFPAASVTSTPGTVAAGSLAVAHAYRASGACAAGPRVDAATPCSGSVLPAGVGSATDAVTNTGTSTDDGLVQEVTGTSCATVRLDNARTPTNPMLPRNNVGFGVAGPMGTTNAISLDGAGAHAASVTTDRLMGGDLTVLGAAYGEAVWFRTSSTTGGAILSLGSSPTAVASTDDNALWINPDGTLSFVHAPVTAGSGVPAGARTTTTGRYNDGGWHLVYVRMVIGTLNLTGQTTITVDGVQVGQSSPTASYTSSTGYWHLGWAPPAITGLASAWFTGSLSNLVIFGTSPAPSAPTSTDLASQSAYTAWSSSTTDRWVLGDTGTTTWSGAQPVIGTTSPCTMLSIAWSATSPAATVLAPTPLSVFVAGGPYPFAADPGPGVTQTSTLTIATLPGYSSYVAGLRLLVPVTHRWRTPTVTGGTPWSLTFTWSGATAVVIA